MPFIEGLSLLSVLIASLCLGFVFFYYFRVFRNSNYVFHAIVTMMLIVNLLMQISLPLILGFLYNFKIELLYNISLITLSRVIFYQLFYLVIFFFVFKFNYRFSKSNDSFKRNLPNLPSGVFLFMFLGIFLLLTNFSVSSGELGQFNGVVDVNNADTPWDVFTIYLRTMFEYTSICATCLIVFSKDVKRFIKILSILLIIGIVIRQLAIGLRGGIFIISILITLVYFFKNRSIPLLRIMPLLLVLVPIFSFLGGSFREEITRGYLQEADTLERFGFVVDKLFVRKNSVVTDDLAFVEALYSRLEAARNSVCLINEYESGNSVNFKPFISSLISFIPQSVSGIRNYAGSSTEDMFGSAMYFVRFKTYGFSDMGPFLTCAHEYWEGGLLYMLLSALFLGLVVRFILHNKNNISSPWHTFLFFLLLLDAHHGEMSITPPLSLLLRLFFFQIIPTFLFLKLVNMLIGKTE